MNKFLYLKSYHCLQIIKIRYEYFWPYDCVQIISIKKEYLKRYDSGNYLYFAWFLISEAYQPSKVIKYYKLKVINYYRWRDKWSHALPNGVSPKVNVIAGLIFKLAYNEIVAHYVNQYAKETTRLVFCRKS